MSVRTIPESPFWQYEFQRDGGRFRGSFNGKGGLPKIPKDRPKREAERAEAILRDRADRPLGSKRMSVHEVTSQYWLETAQHFKSASGEFGRLANIERILGKSTLFDALTDADFSHYVAKRRGETARNKKTPPSAATINRELECVGRIIKRARSTWKIKIPDIDLIAHKMPEPRERVRALTSDEDRALFAAIDEIRPDFRDMLEFALLTGKRLSEVIGLIKRKVDRKAMTARVTQKGGQEIVIALTESSLAIIERNWLHHPDFVFTYICKQNNTGKQHTHRKGLRYPFTPNGWRKDWKAIIKKAGIEDFRFHDLRHTAGTRVLAATNNLKLVQDTLSHSSIASSARYAHTNTDQRRDALRAAENLRSPENSQNDESGNEKSSEKSNA